MSEALPRILLFVNGTYALLNFSKFIIAASVDIMLFRNQKIMGSKPQIY
jgi:hypothetical protein